MRRLRPLGLCWVACFATLVGLLYATVEAAAAAIAVSGPEAGACAVRDACVFVQHVVQQAQQQEPAAGLEVPPLGAPAELELSEAEEDLLDLNVPPPGRETVEAAREDFEEGHEDVEEAADGGEEGEEGEEDEDGDGEAGADEGDDAGEGEGDAEKEEDEADGTEEGEEDEGEEAGEEEDEGEDGDEGEEGAEKEQGEEDKEEDKEEGAEDDAAEEKEGEGEEVPAGAAAAEEASAEPAEAQAGAGPKAAAEAGAPPRTGEEGAAAQEKAAAEGFRPKETKEQPGAEKAAERGEAAAAAAAAPEFLGDAGDANGVLLFFAVGSTNVTMDLVTRNINHLRKTFKGARADVFLAHYDKNQAAWLARDEEWYRKHVQFSTQRRGYKFKLAQATLPKLLKKREPYEWIWLLDEDADFSSTNIWRMLRDAEVTRAQIVAPSLIDMRVGANGTAVQNSTTAAPQNKTVASLLQVQTQTSCKPGSLMCQHQAPHKYCHYRYVTFLEVMFPLVRQKALLKLLGPECEHCLHERSVWGLDKVWCRFTARMLNVTYRRTCAILDRVSVVHTDHRTMEKWGSNGNIKKSITQVYTADQMDTMKYHEQDNGFSADSTCVLPPKKVKFRRKKAQPHLRCQHPREHETGRRRRRRRGCSNHKNSRRRRRWKVAEKKKKKKAKEKKDKYVQKQLKAMRRAKFDFKDDTKVEE